MTKERDSFIFYRSFNTAMAQLNDEEYGKCVRAISQYALDRIEPELCPITYMAFEFMRPQIDANHERYENGKKGGRPLKNKNKKPVVSKSENQWLSNEKPNGNVNGNGNANVNENLLVQSSPGSDEKEYAWVGKLIRLTPADYDKWEKQFKRVNLDEELQALDKYYSENPPPKNAWFYPVFHSLKRKEKQAFKKLYGAQL